MRIITIDGNKILSANDLHSFLSKELDFPEYYGMNLDALWDVMNEYTETPIHIEWINYDDSMLAMVKFYQLFKDLSGELNGFSFSINGKKEE